MGKTYYTKITYKGKTEYLWDSDGDWIRSKGKFEIDKTKNKKVTTKLTREFNTLTKGIPYIKNRVKGIKNAEKRLYYAKVWILTEANDLTKLKNHKRRSFKGFHLDHIYPISQGFKQGIPPEAIAHIDNLQFMPAKRNLKKRDTITESTKKLITEIQKKL